MAAISRDLRKRILLALAHDSSSLRVAERFKVSPSFVRKLRIQVRRTGSPAPIPRPGKERLVKGAVEERLRELLEEHRDATLIELAAMLKKRTRVSVSETTMWRTLRRMGITLKKRSSTRASSSGRT